MERPGNATLRGEIAQTFVLMGMVGAVLGTYLGLALLAVRALGG